MVAHTFNCSVKKAGRSLQVQDQPGLQSKLQDNQGCKEKARLRKSKKKKKEGRKQKTKAIMVQLDVISKD